MEKTCIIGLDRDDTHNRFISEMRTLLAEAAGMGAPTVVEHEWWKHPVFHRGHETKFTKIGNYIFTVDYSSHEAEDEKGIYYNQEMCIKKDLPDVAKKKISEQIKDIKQRFYDDPYFEDMAKRLEGFLTKI